MMTLHVRLFLRKLGRRYGYSVVASAAAVVAVAMVVVAAVWNEINFFP